ncbi:Alpha-1,3-mannosyltransferase-like protein [Kickxella alabastrina]|uniref:Alpha-1,3-mannosyltransferase-like protein n=1 Tax=Kickxella alabastrina TaxID=61397 RepID=A0ACC1I8X1_9FUNG|nr:Alpha-1,3-mannosyltransferase-like protein [Kickxella alabastrina]
MRRLTIGFVHPNLGIGGAERLVVDAALSLQNLGHKVIIHTLHHDVSHCFAETRDGTLQVRTGGNQWFLPRSIFGHMHILCTILRSLALANQVAGDREQYDVLFVDQLSAPIPLLRFAQARIFFYCHFPDYLQAPHAGVWRRMYRLPFDLLEEFTTREADEIVVNSRFTQEAFQRAFPRIAQAPRVLQPALNLAAYDQAADAQDAGLWGLRTQRPLVASINRFERKKNVGLAIDALALLHEGRHKDACLVVAGGWDADVAENAEHLAELVAHAHAKGLRTRTLAPQGSSARARARLPPGAEPAPLALPAATGDEMASVDVVFLPSFSANQRAHLLGLARCLVYTPSNEHLGIVPLEAMYMRVPVVAANSGGPRETVVHAKTGFLCEPTPDAFAEAVAAVLGMDGARRREMGEAGRARVAKTCALEAFGERLERLMYAMLEREPHAPVVLGVVMTAFIVGTVAVVLVGAALV